MIMTISISIIRYDLFFVLVEVFQLSIIITPMLSRFWSKPIIPLLIINSSLDQQKSANLLRKLNQINFKKAKALAMVIEINNHMPVQIDKIAEFLQEKRQQHSLKLYGFCHANVTLESYYLLSKADLLYTMPTSIFQLERGVKYFDTEQFLKKIGVKKETIKSHSEVVGNFMDTFTSVNTAKYLNQKVSELNETIYSQSIAHRKQRKGIELQCVAPSTMIGVEAVAKGYVDEVGSYYSVLKGLYPECQISHVRLKQKPSTRTLQLLVASPIIIVLFMIKVIIKYTIIMYLWIKHKNNKKKESK